jgi:transposase InsO family protein
MIAQGLPIFSRFRLVFVSMNYPRGYPPRWVSRKSGEAQHSFNGLLAQSFAACSGPPLPHGRELLVSVRGAPAFIRSDNGPEFVSAAILRCLNEHGIHTAHIAPGKPWENGSDESFNGRFRDECLNQEWFRNRREARSSSRRAKPGQPRR